MDTARNINLLPAELRYGFFRKILLYNDSHPKKMILVSLAGLFFLASLITLVQAINSRRYRIRVARVETSLNQLQASHKEAEGLMNQIAQSKQTMEYYIALLNARRTYLEKQYNYDHHWAVTLRELNRLVPDGIWLTGFSIEDYYLKLQGGGYDEKNISNFMALLRKSPAFSNVSFNFTQSSKVGDKKVILFEVTSNCDLRFSGDKI